MEVNVYMFVYLKLSDQNVEVFKNNYMLDFFINVLSVILEAQKIGLLFLQNKTLLSID